MPDFDRDHRSSPVSRAGERASSVSNTYPCWPEPDFLKDADKIGSAKYNFIVAIESCNRPLQTNVISRNRLRAPEDYGDTFRVLQNQAYCRPRLRTN